MFEGYEKIHITSNDSSLSVDGSEGGVSLKGLRITSSVEVNQPTGANYYAKVTMSRYFLICDSCLWNASYYADELNYVKCPVCREGKIRCMPIHDEDKNSYSFNDSYNIVNELIYSKNMRS